MIFIKNTYPFLSNLIEKIPNTIGKWITWIFIVFMIFNIIISAVAVRRWTNRRMGIPAGNVVSEFLDELYPDEYMQKIYPNMQIAD